ncbi:hypothetical protein F5878DRAFT_392854 [Lentinula raphanica]|uniref:Uncharacterized protein n=1 Tax=Lentinula raphanica TaxID=153919 RepID=A0AA38P0F1_9AGAR|nr:hypothetical protein EV360DRAFT_69715 [Lentinula raphanica]KAJ3833788.1 hypothetical protein F5878DRAFT_392854 [Lentinula raphanica]
MLFFNHIERQWNTARLLLPLISMITTTTALPIRFRRDTAPPSSSVDTVANYMQTALQTYLAGQNGVTNFHAIADGWKTIDFAGKGTSLTGDEAANSIFYIADQIQGATTTISYSGMMVSFMEDVNVAMSLNMNGVNSPAVTKAQQASSKACFSGMAAATTKASKEYAEQNSGRAPNVTSPEFLQFAAQDPDYTQPAAVCQSTTNTYQAALSHAVGDDFYIFSGAMNNINQLTQSLTLIEGLNMEVSSATTSAGLGKGKYKPYYSFPTLNGTMSAWQSTDDGSSSSPAFTWSSTSSSGSTTNTTSSSGAGVGFFWEDLSGSGAGSSSSSKSTSNVTSVGMSVSFGQISMFGVDFGLWDAIEVAESLQNPPDEITKKGVPAFQKYYGSASKPGPLASWKDQALIVYQPSFSVEFSSADEASEFHKTAATAGFCIFIICVGGSGSSSSSTMNYSTGSRFVTYNDTTNQAYLVGFTQTNFFVNQGPQDDSNWSLLAGNNTDTASSSTDSSSVSTNNSTTDAGSSSSDSGTDTDSASTGDSSSDTGSVSSTNDTTSAPDSSSPPPSSPSKNNGTSSNDSSSTDSSTSDSSSTSAPDGTSANSDSPSDDPSSSSASDGTSATDSTSTTSANNESPSDTPSSASGNAADKKDPSSSSAAPSKSTSQVASMNRRWRRLR